MKILRKTIGPEQHHKKYRMKKKLTLRRDLGLLEATSAGVGIISGAGIYALMGAAAGMAGNSVWLSFIFASFVAVFTGLSYAELSSMFPRDSGEYVYTESAFGSKLAFMVGWLILSSGIIAVSTVALGFGGYFKALFGTPMLLAAVGIIITIGLINFYGVKESAKLNITFTLIEVAGLIIIILVGLSKWGSVNYMEMPHGTFGMFSAASLIFFAFIGFESVVKLAEETKNPEKVIPRALLLSILITTVLYILVAISAVSVLDWQTLGASEAPLADVAAAALGSKAFMLLAVIALFSTANTILISILSTSRIAYGMGVDKSLPKSLAVIHPGRQTPWIAIFMVTAIAILFAVPKNIGAVAEMANLSIFVTFLFVNMSLIMLRYTDPKMKRPFRAPFNIGNFSLTPVIGMALCLFMLFNLDLIIIAGGIVLILTGFLFYKWYEFFEHIDIKIRYVEKPKGAKKRKPAPKILP
jgi:APA family basic amino acid/polyamine antiporter